jgi:hypothetical protein
MICAKSLPKPSSSVTVDRDWLMVVPLNNYFAALMYFPEHSLNVANQFSFGNAHRHSASMIARMITCR